ncbi:ABC transporter G family member 9-like protein [Tanacetum coccineum]|uniref:ABC transporter G family member 9-like protein n=1 Tax=Tanacetum coccineum TaxID=301880 RepID=A0ABQ5CN82_9ASTR
MSSGGGGGGGSGDADNGVDDREKVSFAYDSIMKQTTGFVTEDDILYPHLTFTETLVFTALLHLHKSLIKQQMVEQAEAVINQLGLTKCKTSIIGLDSTTAQRIVLTLWELTRGGISSDESSQNAETESDTNHIQDQSGLLFFYIDFSGFFPLFHAIFTFPQEREMLEKERSSGMYKLSSYFMVRTSHDQTLDTGLLDGWAQTRRLALGALVMDLKSAVVLGSVIMLSFMLAGGYYVQNVPPFISWIKYASYLQALVGISI